MKLRLRKLNQLGFDHMVVVVFIVVFGGIGGTYYALSHANPWNGSGALQLGYNNKTLCMQNMDNSNTAITTVQAATCNSTSQSQNWTVKTISGNNFEIIASASNACVGDYGGAVQTATGVANRVYAATESCNKTASDSPQELWHWGGTGDHQLINVASGGCINYPTTNNSVGRLDVYSCSSTIGGAGSNAEWYVGTNTAKSGSGGTTTGTTNITGSQLSVGPKGSKYCMDSSSVVQGGHVVLNSCSTSKASQGWTFVSAGTISGGGKTIQMYIIKNMASGTNQCLDDYGQSVVVGDTNNPLRLYTCKANDHGQQFVWAGDGHQLRSVSAILHNPSFTLCIDNSGGLLKANNTVGFYTCKTSTATNQDWYKQ